MLVCIALAIMALQRLCTVHSSHLGTKVSGSHFGNERTRSQHFDAAEREWKPNIFNHTAHSNQCAKQRLQFRSGLNA